MLIDVTVFWTMETDFTVTNIREMIRDGINSNSTYKLNYDIISVNLNEGNIYLTIGTWGCFKPVRLIENVLLAFTTNLIRVT